MVAAAGRLQRPDPQAPDALLAAEVGASVGVVAPRLAVQRSRDIPRDHPESARLAARVEERTQDEIPGAVADVVGGVALVAARTPGRPVALTLTAMVPERQILECLASASRARSP